MGKGYNASARVASAPKSYYEIVGSDFGAPVPVLVTLTTGTTTAASLSTTGHVFVETSWITANGEGTASNEVSVAINTTTTDHYVVVTQPIVPTAFPTVGALSGQTIVGWRIYSAYTTGGELLNTANDTTNFTITNPAGGTSVIAGIAISSNSAATQTILVIGSGAAPQTVDHSGIQAPLPSLAQDVTTEYYAIVPNSGSLWRQQSSVDFMRPDGIADPAGIQLNHLDFIQPVYPGAAQEPQGGANPPSATYTQATLGPGVYMVMNGSLFVSTQPTSTTTAATFIGTAAFAVAKGTTVTDGNVTWLCLGKAGLVRFAFTNVNATAAAPAVQGYSLFQH